MESTSENVYNRSPEPVTSPEEVDIVLVPAGSEISPVLTVVMPTLNEEEGIRDCIKRIKSAVRELEIPTEVIVSDSSSDRTPQIAREEGAIVVHPDGRGYGYAYRYAFQYARGDYIAIGDADTTYDFKELPKLYTLLHEENADMALGSRLNGEIKPGAMPALHRYVGNPLLTRFLNGFYKAGVSDAHSGFRLIKRDALEGMNLRSDGMEFASEMIMEASTKGLRIEEVPITYHERKGEATLDSFRDGWRHVRFMLVNAPGYLYSVPGALLCGLGVLTMAVAASGVSINGTSLGIHSAIVGSLLTIVGYQIASLGVFATLVGDPIRKPEDPITRWIIDNLSLERGVGAGCVLFGIGGLYAGYSVLEWVLSGFLAMPFTVGSLLAFTAIILGVQTVFSAFFMSSIASLRNTDRLGFDDADAVPSD